MRSPLLVLAERGQVGRRERTLSGIDRVPIQCGCILRQNRSDVYKNRPFCAGSACIESGCEPCLLGSGCPRSALLRCYNSVAESASVLCPCSFAGLRSSFRFFRLLLWRTRSLRSMSTRCWAQPAAVTFFPALQFLLA